jgi:hypothetical protein
MFFIDFKMHSASNTDCRTLHKGSTIQSVKTASDHLSFHEMAILASHLMTFSMAGPSEVKKAKAYEEIETCQY